MDLHLDDYQARRVGWALSLLLESLRQADDEVRDELADFGFGLRTEPRRHLEQLLDDLAEHRAALRPQSPAPIGTGGAA